MTEKINLSRIFRDPLVKPALLKTSAHLDTPTVVYNLVNLLGFNVFNLKKLFNNLNVKVFLDKNFILPCEYTVSLFGDK